MEEASREEKPVLDVKNLAVSFDTYAGEVQAVRECPGI